MAAASTLPQGQWIAVEVKAVGLTAREGRSLAARGPQGSRARRFPIHSIWLIFP